MSSSDEAGNHANVVQMNAELRNAQLELLSAQCATDRLRLRHSLVDIARHANRDVLRKACSSANALYEYYSSIVGQVPGAEASEKSGMRSSSGTRTAEFIVRVADFFRIQREHFRPNGLPLNQSHRQIMEPHFSPTLLEQVRTVCLVGERLPGPAVNIDIRDMGMRTPADMTHTASLTCEDVLVFQDEITARSLFHALVHAVQFEVMGLDRYSELLVRGWLRTGSYMSAPIEVHASQLESQFAEKPAKPFSVEEKVRLWTNQGRY